VTAYTPYQPELSQGTLQSLFEYQSFIVELTDMELSNCSMYDGASSAAEAMLMAHRIKHAPRILVAASVNPAYLATVRTYVEPHGIAVETVATDESGQVSQTDLERLLAAGPCSAVLVQSPNYVGVIEDLPALGQVVHAHDTLFVECFTEAMALGLLGYGIARAPTSWWAMASRSDCPCHSAALTLAYLQRSRSSTGSSLGALWASRWIRRGARRMS